MTEKYLLKNGIDVVTLSHRVEDSAERVTIHLNDRQIGGFSQSQTAAFPDNVELDSELKLLLKYVRGPEGNFFIVQEGDRRLVGFSRLQKSPRLIAQVVFWYQLVVLSLYAVLFFFSGQNSHPVLRIIMVLGAIYALVVLVAATRLRSKPDPKSLGLLYRLCFIDVILSMVGAVLGNGLGLGLLVLLMKVLFLVYFSRRKNVFADLETMAKVQPAP